MLEVVVAGLLGGGAVAVAVEVDVEVGPGGVGDPGGGAGVWVAVVEEDGAVDGGAAESLETGRVGVGCAPTGSGGCGADAANCGPEGRG